jgi:hypothetical protein
LFTKGHLLNESRQVRNTEYRPGRLISADADLIDCFRWLANLPQEPATPGTNAAVGGKSAEKLQPG